jgi:predicted flap endonuclease-1-like 5' DNA nuclease
MIFTTPTQLAVLALCLIAGWLFGMASSSGGAKWRDRVRALEAEHAAYRKDAEARIAAAEAERDTLAAAGPAATGADTRPAHIGFFGWGRDNLSRITGIDETLERRINAAGFKTYQQIETLSAEDEADLERRLELNTGTILRDNWRAQAATLRASYDEMPVAG